LIVGTEELIVVKDDHDSVVRTSPRSQSFVTLLVQADHKYTHDPRPTACTRGTSNGEEREEGCWWTTRTFCDDQSTKFR
jgi:hypothetical protein